MSIQSIKQELLTQDNRCTDQPVFLVQQLIRDYGFSPEYSDEYAWIGEDYEEADDELASKLEEYDQDEVGLEDGTTWVKNYYNERWEFVQAFFTEKGAEDYLASNGHSLGKVRIYADVSFRNFEFREIREFILNYE